ncbi:MAG: heme A synthase [Chloroflexi bacterium]|nr:MAG: heme A synthase [Chloroflexota bacterium]
MEGFMAVSTATRTSTLLERRLLPGLALSALISTVLLVLMGSIVRVTGNGLGCPDWPLCYGRAIPPALTGAWMEFTHRMIGGLTSLQIVLLGWLAWRGYRTERWIFRPATAAVALLVVQIVLGGLHVILEIPPATGLVHTGVAMLIVGLIAVVVAVAMPAAQRLRRAGGELFHNARFVSWVSWTTAATYFLLLTGSYVTRRGASLACPSFPWCGSNAPGIHALIQLQMLHRYTAFSVAFLTLVTIAWLLSRRKEDRRVRRFAYGLGVLLIAQFGLGIANVLLRLPMWSRALHLTVGATFWASLVVLWTTVWLARGED